MAAANDLRPVQARGSLESMIRRQLELRQSETEALHAKCDSLEVKLSELRQSLKNTKSSGAPSSQFAGRGLRSSQESSARMDIADDDILKADQSTGDLPTQIASDDVLRWAEEVR